MEIYQFKYVLAVAKYKSFTRAADEVCVTPSSLSQQIKKLEDELGISLFGRTTRSVHLTPAGIEFVQNAQKVMDSISNINNSLKKYVEGESGELSVGGLPALKAFGITPVIASFQKNYPKISLNVTEAECFNLYPLLYSGKIDVAILTAFNKAKPGKIALSGYPLFYDELVLVTSTSHPFASKTVIDLAETSKEKFIGFCQSSGLFIDTIDACHEAGFEPNFIFTTSYVDTLMGLVAEGEGIALITSRTVTNTLWKNVAVVRLKKPAIRTIYLVLPKKPNLSPVLLNFKNYFIHWAKENKEELVTSSAL